MFNWFENTGMEAAYLLCLVGGLAYAAISAILHAVGVGHSGDVSGGHDVGGGEVSGDSSVHFSPLSPVTITMFITSFGAGGIVSLHVFKIEGLGSLGVATLSGTSFGKYGEGYVRLSYANSIPNLEKALERFAGMAATLRGKAGGRAAS